MAAIEVNGLVRTFDDVEAVRGIDLAVDEGEIYGFLGPNGAGKSTAVRMLCTLLLPTAGSARVAGYDVVDQPGEVRLRIGVALQEASLDDKQSGREILELQGRLYGLSRADVERRVREVVEFVDIGDAIDRRLGTYSGGMERRLDLAAALVHQPEVLFLDEPTTGLDPISRVRVWEEIRRLNDELGVTIFLTTQYMDEADELADRIGIIAEGRLEAEGTPADLKRAIGHDVIVADVPERADAAEQALLDLPGVESVDRRDGELQIVSENGAELLGPVAVALDRCGVGVRSLTMRSPTLDDVFLATTGAQFEEGP